MAKQFHNSELDANLLQYAGALIVVLDRNGGIVRFNHACEKLSGYSYTELKGKTLWDTLLSAQDAHTFQKDIFEKILEQTQHDPIKHTHIWKSKNKTLYRIAWSVSSQRNEAHVAEHIVCVGSDVTEDYLIRKSLKESEQRFHDLADQAPIMIGVTDETGHIIFLNKTWLEFRGKTIEEEEGWAWAAGLHPDDRERTLSEMESCIQQLKSYSIEYRIQDRHGDYHWLLDSAIPRFGVNGEALGYIGTATNITDSKRNFEVSQKLIERLDLATRSAHIGIWDWDIVNNELVWDDAMFHLYGVRKEDFTGAYEAWLAGLHPDDIDQAEQAVQLALENKKIYDIDFRVCWPDGNIRYIQANGQVFWDKQGQPLRMLGINYDITQRKEAEVALKHSEILLEKAQELTHIGHWRLNIETQEVTGSNELFRIFGLSSEEATLDAFIEVVHPDDRERDLAAIQGGAENGEPWDIEHRLVCRDGTEKWVHAIGKANLDSKGTVTELIGTVQDITERKNTEAELEQHQTRLEELVNIRTKALESEVLDHKKAEEALRESEQRLQAIMATAVEGIVTINHCGIVEAFNSAAEKLFGFTSDEVIGQNISMLMLEKDRQEHDNYINRYLKTGESRVIGRVREVEGRHKNGSIIPLELSVSELHLHDRRLFTGILHNISKRKQQESALLKATADAESANKAKSEFLASMSHELRTPMNSILGFGQLLTMAPGDSLTESQSDCVDQILTAGQHLLDLINGILNLAEIETGNFRLSIEDIQVVPLIDKCLKLIEILAKDKDIHIENNTGGLDYKISADYTRTRQIILNLLSNAIKYNHEGGSVIINYSTVSSLVGSTPAEMCRISISDTGPGIPANKHSEIFLPFNRLGVESENTEGTGIGLTVSKNLVELMKGKIDFESELDKGSTFWVELPLVPKHYLKEESNQSSSAGISNEFPKLTGKLLYVEDNPANVILMKHIVSNIEGLTMHTATTAEEGVDIAIAKRPDIIILDINLPQLSGIDALAVLQRIDETKSIPTIALSASASQADIDEGLKAGFLRYMTKPLNVADFIDVLQEILLKKKVDSGPGD